MEAWEGPPISSMNMRAPPIGCPIPPVGDQPALRTLILTKIEIYINMIIDDLFVLIMLK